jgi:hypothetical protein
VKYVEIADEFDPKITGDMDAAAAKWRDYCAGALMQVARNQARDD